MKSKLGRQVWTGHNLVTNDGEQYYTECIQRGIFEAFAIGATITPTDDMNSLYVGTDLSPGLPVEGDTLAYIGTPATVEDEAAVVSGFPKVNDTDTVNGGRGTNVLTWKFTYPTSDAIGTLTKACISIAAQTPVFTANALTCTREDEWTPAGDVVKTASDTFTFYANHTLVGA
jgi:hypothetical protein